MKTKTAIEHVLPLSRGGKGCQNLIVVDCTTNSAKPFKLPTLAAFKRLSLRRRTEVFLSWVRTQKGGYDPVNPRRCALAQFGQQFSRDLSGDGPGNGLSTGTLRQGNLDNIPVLKVQRISAALKEPHTFASLAKRLERHLATT